MTNKGIGDAKLMTKQDTTASAMKITWMTAGENFWLKNTITKGSTTSKTFMMDQNIPYDASDIFLESNTKGMLFSIPPFARKKAKYKSRMTA